MAISANYAFNGVDFHNVLEATGDGNFERQEASAPGVPGSILFDLGERGETYRLRLFVFDPNSSDIESELSAIIRAVTEPGPHNLKWHNRTFLALAMPYTFGPYHKTSAGRRVELNLEFRTPSVATRGD